MRLENKVALITGGARGQGAVEAKLFASEGARVVFGDILDDEGIKVEAEIKEAGGEASYLHLDVIDEGDWQKAIDLVISKYGKLDILVNNARDSTSKRIQHHRNHYGGNMGPRHGGKHQGCVSRDQIRHPADATSRRGIHHQPIFRCGNRSHAGHSFCLFRQQGSGPAVHQVHGHSTRQGQHQVQLGTPGSHRYPNA